MLSTLVQRQKLWTVPLLVSLAFSWCLMLCQNVAQAATVTSAAMEQTTPPCHSAVNRDDAAEMPLLSIQPLSSQQHCAGCDNQAASAEPVQLAFSAIFITWQKLPAVEFLPTAIPASQLHTPPPKPRLPLYLSNNQLRI
ncbi:hypothetical protein [Rheinheimera sp. UJ63]|uniref:hypothetical protein n=1 Tax=Rheinheimera sp. UJ63 TaxID=2910157 RepID=UPI001F2F8515|nr:hypothetical protein [Rheinheimera sp. UJ63]MCF4010369.1 hypothetical protein [Rheinheimera sp. UJ63]